MESPLFGKFGSYPIVGWIAGQIFSVFGLGLRPIPAVLRDEVQVVFEG
jgi:hypothetical protein